jgi:hypothetical protein
VAYDPWLNCGVEGWAPWPDISTTMHFDGREIRLLPPDEKNCASVHLQIKRSRLDELAADTLVNRFLSALSWCHDQPMERVFGWSGNPQPVSVPRPRRPKQTTPIYPLRQFSPKDPKRRLAMALFREARTINSVAYSFLGYFKIIGIVCKRGPDHVAWINIRLPMLRGEQAQSRVREIAATHQNVGGYLYESGRCAIAHAFSEPLVDPDDADHIRRLRADLPVVAALATHLMEKDFGLGRRWLDERAFSE